jgi:hypothetical protein
LRAKPGRLLASNLIMGGEVRSAQVKTNEKSRRIRERLSLALLVRVEGKDPEARWNEVTRLIDVTPFGARFRVRRPTEPGRLLYLTLAMPRQLRCFDHVEDHYRVWSLARSVRTLQSGGDEPVKYEVGVAFIGKRPPASYANDPTRRYNIALDVTDSGLWMLRETERDRGSSGEDLREETRHHIPFGVTVEMFGEDGKVSKSESTVTENISPRGASVLTTLDVAPGRFLRLTSSQYGLSVLAAVRALRRGADGIMRLHMEFVDQRWPLE